MDLSDKKTIIEILQKNGLFAKKRFGQNFLINRQELEKIVTTAKIEKTENVIEIGPGLGVLTQKLLQKAKKVICLELDGNIIPILKANLSGVTNLEIINIDALKFIPPKMEYKIVANIPYYITSPILNHFLQVENKPKSITLLVQKEVAEKICMRDGKQSILSLEVALFGTPKIISRISASSFFPAPKVDSSILHIEVFDKNHEDFIPKNKALEILNLAKICFSQKRKKLSNTLPEEYHENATVTGISLSRRPETLTISDWTKLIQ